MNDKRDLHNIYLIAVALVCCAFIIGYNATKAVPLGQTVFSSNEKIIMTDYNKVTSSQLQNQIADMESRLFLEEDTPSDNVYSEGETFAVSSEVSQFDADVYQYPDNSEIYYDNPNNGADNSAADNQTKTSNKANYSGKVNINTASAEEMQERLSGIGAVKAEAIVAYREMYGPFTSVDELINVSGIGEKTLEKIYNDCTV